MTPKKKKRTVLGVGLLLLLQGCVVMTRRRYNADIALAVSEGELIRSSENLKRSIRDLKSEAIKGRKEAFDERLDLLEDEVWKLGSRLDLEEMKKP